MIIKTRIFELSNGRYRNLTELAQAMGISVSQIYRVREGKRNINQSFIIGSMKAFPEAKLDDLFYFAPSMSAGNATYYRQRIIARRAGRQGPGLVHPQRELAHLTSASNRQ